MLPPQRANSLYCVRRRVLIFPCRANARVPDLCPHLLQRLAPSFIFVPPDSTFFCSGFASSVSLRLSTDLTHPISGCRGCHFASAFDRRCYLGVVSSFAFCPTRKLVATHPSGSTHPSDCSSHSFGCGPGCM